MSSYIQFFLRGGDTFYPISAYSRGSAVYRAFNAWSFAPWEKITPVTSSMLKDVTNEIDQNLRTFRKNKREVEELIDKIGDFNNSIDEKYRFINECRCDLQEYQEEIEAFEYSLNFVEFLSDMLIESRGVAEEDEYVYVGMEVGIPTVEDIA